MTLKQRILGFPGVAQLTRPYFAWRFRNRITAQSQHGVYADFADAAGAIPKGCSLTSYDNDEAGQMYGWRPVFSYDYVVMHWLHRFAPAGSRVFDFGGHSGKMYDAMRTVWPEISQLDWTVYDVPAAVAHGDALNSERPTPIRFTTDPKDGDGADVWVVSGCTQYIERPLREFLGDLQELPKILLINQTPLHDRLSFATLQRLTNTIVPYLIRTRAEFVSDLESLGYQVEAVWDNPGKFCVIPTYPEHSRVPYIGLCAIHSGS